MKVWAADYTLGSRTLTRGRHTFPDKFEIRARACAAVAVKVLPTAEVAKDAVVGDGTQTSRQAQVRKGARIGKQCRIGKGVYIDANVVVGHHCNIQNYVSV